MSQASIITLSILLLVGLVAAVAIAVLNYAANNDKGPTTSAKAVQEMCQPTDYKEACFKSLGKVNSDDPKELVRAAFESTKDEIKEVADKSEVLKELAEDPKTAEAVKDCKELFQDAIDDLQRSFEEIGEFDINKVNMILENIKIWLSATLTYQETCLDGFDNSTGDASEKVRKALQTAMQMSSNGLAIVNEMSILLSNLEIPSFNRRRLLTLQRHVVRRDNNNVIQNWLRNRRLLSSVDDNVDSSLLEDDEPDRRRRRRLLSSNNRVVGLDDDDELMPTWLDGRRRKLLESSNLAEDLKAKANVIVAQDRSGKYKTIEQALQDIPKYGNDSFIVYIKEGVYNEYLVLFKWMTHVVFVGDGPTKTRIINNKNFEDGTKTFKTATLSVLGDFFMAKDIGVENSAGAIKHQAVALRVQSDQSIFFNCQMDGYQDTLYTHTYRQYYRDCRVTGTIDFIFGDAAAFFQNCTFVVRKPLDNQRCIVTAQGRMERHQPTGIIIHKSRFEADPDYYPVRKKNTAYLGRPWKEYSKTIIMESHIDDLIAPDGWLPWEGTFGLETCYYGEYNNVGPGSDMSNRVKWRGIKNIVHDRAEKYMPSYLYENDEWIRASGVPYDPYLSALAPGPAFGFASIFSSSSSSGHSSPSLSSLSSSSSSSHSHSHSSSSSLSSSGQLVSSSSSNDNLSSSSSDNLSASSASSSGSSSKGSSSSSSGSYYENPSSVSSSTPQGNNNDASKSTTNGNESGPTEQRPTELGSKGSSSYSKTPSPSPSSSTSTSTSTPIVEITPSSPISESPTPTPEYSPSKAPTATLTPSLSTSLSSLLVPTTSPIETVSKGLSPTTSPSSSPSSTTTEIKRNLIGPVTIHELERILMTNEEIEEGDEVNDDMAGNVPDGDEPSPTMVEQHSPASAPSMILSPSLSKSIGSSSPSPSVFNEVSDLLSPATTPEPEAADELPPPVSPKFNNAISNSKLSDLYIILSGVVLWVSITM
ncbi:hypothetical protein KSS87_006923 [Heliosperma pusillum]|nr:hypothetical protein KSS87_006923 [Heliosperma pusillum]